MDLQAISKNIQTSAKVVGTTWPLYAFVTSNPLSGYESLPFKEACFRVFTKTGSIAYPEVSFFKHMMEQDFLSEKQVQDILNEHDFQGEVKDFLSALNTFQNNSQLNPNHEVDQILVKWLSVFLDEGLADWQMPDKKQGFYQAWKSLAKYDQNLAFPKGEKLPKSSLDAIHQLTAHLSEAEQLQCFENHFAALPGWVGYIKYRKDNQTDWQENFPLELEDYLAVRLLITKFLGSEVKANVKPSQSQQQLLNILQQCLAEVENHWQKHMLQKLNLKGQTQDKTAKPDAQLVFCIDTRSELIRRNIESKGNYETYGYAGFFGIAMDYEAAFTGLTRKSCPPILSSAFKVTEQNTSAHTQSFQDLETKHKKSEFKGYFLKRMKNILPSAFGFVEGAGLAYAYQLLYRTFGKPKKNKNSASNSVESICETQMHKVSDQSHLSVDEQTQIVKSAFDLTGWKTFAPLIVFAGHGSHTANNPFASSLDCGACAASPGRHNARMIAKLANSKEVRLALKEKHGILVPEDTLFLGAEHNTTTDEIELFDAEAPEEFKDQIRLLKKDLAKAQISATSERLGQEDSVNQAYKKSTDWSETRPEWGLAKNAGFIIGDRNLTKDSNLDGQCFLHSYDWEKDKDGSALNAILNGPMVVTQWINNHYYFSTVDNNMYGSGSKITHNIVGKFGVVQGNGGDLKSGLPLQSVKLTDEENYHQPQRLSVFIHAPKSRLNSLISDNEKIKELLDNQWIHLLVIDPERENQVEKYVGHSAWESITKTKYAEAVMA
ncbi:DUF2309 domain-containing protein [Psychroflexus aestuariivivens]|uniref:DUF2309 domain-containing protein n=1 Tax=Psychroflexus aestuariivivens TaxID=1795040 RepID=UPI000FD7A4E6|nr:DUF2309 domain-containing protein [Psychroflexus aestuariivivens]